MSDFFINVSVTLLGSAHETLGQMDFQLPTEVLAKHSDPKKLEKLVQEELMPDAVEQCLAAHIAAKPEAARDTELERIDRACMKLFVDDKGESMEFYLNFDHG